MIFTAKGIVKGLLVDWSQITGIPARVNEIAALGDPGARRFVVWDDAGNQLDYLDLNAAEVPYDNSGSGLTATDVQAAIDEVYAALTASGVFAGFIDASSLGSSQLPAGWSVANPATGRFAVTHNLGLTNVFDLSIAPSARLSAGSTDDRYALITNEGTNSFEILVNDVGAGPVNDDSYFLAKLNV